MAMTSATDSRTKCVWPIYMRAPDGKRHRVHATENTDGFGAHAWVWCGFGKRINQFAGCTDGAVNNLMKRLKADGWREDF